MNPKRTKFALSPLPDGPADRVLTVQNPGNYSVSFQRAYYLPLADACAFAECQQKPTHRDLLIVAGELLRLPLCDQHGDQLADRLPVTA